MWFATCRPTITREYTSRTNAMYTQPDQVRAYAASMPLPCRARDIHRAP